MKIPFLSGEPGADFLSAAQIRTGRILFMIGCGITLLYFPSGLLHLLFGSGVYARDVLLLLHLCACLIWLARTGKAPLFTSRNWFLVVPALFLLPTLAYGAYRVEGATFIKWTACWLDWVILGQLARTVLIGFETPVRVFLGCAALLLLADAGAGLYEAKTGANIIHEEGQSSAFGVKVTKELRLRGRLRINGLQRDVFSYSNLMGMAVVAGLLIFITQQTLIARLLSIFWIVGFATCLFESGGRSAFFGVFAAGVTTAGLLAVPNLTRRYYGIIVSVWLGAALLISAVGVGNLADSIGGSVMHGSDIGNSASAYMRDANWQGITDAIKGLPIVLLSGAPLASLIDPSIDPIYHYADNQYLWLLYHSSIVGLIVIIAYFATMLRLPPVAGSEWARDCLVLFVLFVMGEAVARESMTFLGCMPLFIACGWQSANPEDKDERASWASPGRPAPAKRSASAKQPSFAHRPESSRRPAPEQRSSSAERPSSRERSPSAKRPASSERSSSSRSRNPAPPRSEADEFARRIRDAARNQRKE